MNEFENAMTCDQCGVMWSLRRPGFTSTRCPCCGSADYHATTQAEMVASVEEMMSLPSMAQALTKTSDELRVPDAMRPMAAGALELMRRLAAGGASAILGEVKDEQDGSGGT